MLMTMLLLLVLLVVLLCGTLSTPLTEPASDSQPQSMRSWARWATRKECTFLRGSYSPAGVYILAVFLPCRHWQDRAYVLGFQPLCYRFLLLSFYMNKVVQTKNYQGRGVTNEGFIRNNKKHDMKWIHDYRNWTEAAIIENIKRLS